MSRVTPPAKPSAPTMRRSAGRPPAKAAESLTSESIARDLAEFRKAGGRIEVLGTTWRPVAVRAPEAANAAPAKPARARKSAGAKAG